MVASVDFKITGADALIGKLRAVSYDLKYKGGRAALRKAAQLVVKAARANAQRLDDPQTPDSISKNIVERWDGKRFKSSGDLGFMVGVLGGARATTKGANNSNPGGTTFHWRFKEFGTSRIAATPFMRPALEDNINQATSEFVTQYEKAIDRALKRAKKASLT
jgi:HK97 gp10 family phage protein